MGGETETETETEQNQLNPNPGRHPIGSTAVGRRVLNAREARLRRNAPASTKHRSPKFGGKNLERGATILQARFRGKRAREEMRARQGAATSLQARWRGYQSRKKGRRNRRRKHGGMDDDEGAAPTTDHVGLMNVEKEWRLWVQLGRSYMQLVLDEGGSEAKLGRSGGALAG